MSWRLTWGAIDCYDQGLADEEDHWCTLVAVLQTTLDVHHGLPHEVSPQHLTTDCRQGHRTVDCVKDRRQSTNTKHTFTKHQKGGGIKWDIEMDVGFLMNCRSRLFKEFFTYLCSLVWDVCHWSIQSQPETRPPVNHRQRPTMPVQVEWHLDRETTIRSAPPTSSYVAFYNEGRLAVFCWPTLWQSRRKRRRMIKWHNADDSWLSCPCFILLFPLLLKRLRTLGH